MNHTGAANRAPTIQKHSSRFAQRVSNEFSSTCRPSRQFEMNCLPQVRLGEIGLVVLRSAEHWGVAAESDSESLVIYRGWERQNGHCAPSMRGGRLLMRF